MVRRAGVWAVLFWLLGPVVSSGARAQVPVETAGSRTLPPAPADLPLIEVPSSGQGDAFAVLVSGDGGWASLPRHVSEVLVAGGVPVVGLNALKYFWTRRTPDGAAQDLERIIRYYLPATGRRDVLLVGYSRGADVLPFMVSRLPQDLRQRVRLVALLGPGRTVDFRFHVADWWSNAHRDTDLPILPEVSRLLGGVPLLCVYGEEDTDTVCPQLPAGSAEVVRMKGAHHFDGAYAELGELILRFASRAGV